MSKIIRALPTRRPFALPAGIAALGFFFLSITMASAQTVEFDSDRLGNDFDRVTLGAENYRFCQAICQDTNQCVA